MDDAGRIEALEQANARLLDRIEVLEAALGHHFIAPLESGLTPAEMRMFGGLMAREFCTKDALMAAVYRDDGREEPDVKIVDVFVCKVRKKLKPYGLGIETSWGQGYYLTPAVKAAVRADWLKDAAA